MFSTILVANRGEIAARIIATVQRLGLVPVAVYSEPDRFTLPVRAAARAVALGGVLLGSETMQALLTAAAGIPFCRPSFARATEKKTT